MTAAVVEAPGAPVAESEGAVADMVRLSPDQLVPWPGLNPRRHVREERIREIAASLREEGQLMNLVVHDTGEDVLWIVAGETRWRAAKRLASYGEPIQLLCSVRTYDERRAFKIAMLENSQRGDLTVLEQARGYQRMIEEYGYTQEQIAAEILGDSRKQSQVAKRIGLLALPERVLELVEMEVIPWSYAYDHLIAWTREDDALQERLFAAIVESIRTTRDFGGPVARTWFVDQVARIHEAHRPAPPTADPAQIDLEHAADAPAAEERAPQARELVPTWEALRDPDVRGPSGWKVRHKATGREWPVPAAIIMGRHPSQTPEQAAETYALYWTVIDASGEVEEVVSLAEEDLTERVTEVLQDALRRPGPVEVEEGGPLGAGGSPPASADPAAPLAAGLARCRECGCDDSRACEGGCTWVEVDYETQTGLCSNPACVAADASRSAAPSPAEPAAPPAPAKASAPAEPAPAAPAPAAAPQSSPSRAAAPAAAPSRPAAPAAAAAPPPAPVAVLPPPGQTRAAIPEGAGIVGTLHAILGGRPATMTLMQLPDQRICVTVAPRVFKTGERAFALTASVAELDAQLVPALDAHFHA